MTPTARAMAVDAAPRRHALRPVDRQPAAFDLPTRPEPRRPRHAARSAGRRCRKVSSGVALATNDLSPPFPAGPDAGADGSLAFAGHAGQPCAAGDPGERRQAAPRPRLERREGCRTAITATAPILQGPRDPDIRTRTVAPARPRLRANPDPASVVPPGDTA